MTPTQCGLRWDFGTYNPGAGRRQSSAPRRRVVWKCGCKLRFVGRKLDPRKRLQQHCHGRCIRLCVGLICRRFKSLFELFVCFVLSLLDAQAGAKLLASDTKFFCASSTTLARP